MLTGSGFSIPVFCQLASVELVAADHDGIARAGRERWLRMTICSSGVMLSAGTLARIAASN